MSISWMLFGRELKRRRERVGWTQLELGERVGVASNSIARLESGNRRPSIDLLERLAGALKCRVRDLLPEKRKGEKE